MSKRQKWVLSTKGAGEEVIGLYKGTYSGSTPVDNGYGDENLKKAGATIQAMEQVPRKVWIVVTNRNVSLLGRITKDPILSVPLLQIVFMGYLPASLAKAGVSGSPYGIVQFDPYTRLTSTHVIQLKFAVKITVPHVIKSQCTKALELHLKMKSYDQYLMRATNDDENSKEDEKTGELLGRFPARYIGDVGLEEDTGVGSDAVHSAIQRLRAQLAKIYAARKKKKKENRLAGDDVVITVSSEGITVIDKGNQDTLNTVILDAVCYTSVTQTDDGEELFCFISEDERLDRTSCHIFQMPPGKARETCLIIGAAFQIAGAEAEAQEDNPFKPISERDTLQFPGCLSEKMINRALLKAVKVVGSGQFGKVYLATMKHSLADGAQVDNCAVKLLRGGANTSTKAEFLREAAIMAELAHPNLCSMLGVSIQHRPWLVVLEFIQYGDLREIFHALRDKSITVSNAERLLLCIQIADGMAYLVEKRFVHRDLASRNCLLHQNNQTKVSDFGLSRPFDEGEDHYVMREGARLSMKWTDPGSVVDKLFGEPSDMWSFGVTVWEVWTYCEVPYKDVKNTEIQRRLKEGLRLPQRDDMSDEFYALLLKTFAPRPERWKFRDVEKALRRLYTAEVRAGNPARDVGALLNKGLTEQVRRMTMGTLATTPQPIAAGGAASTVGTISEDGMQDSPTTPASALDGLGPLSQPKGAVFEEITLSSSGDDSRVRMQSVSLATRGKRGAAALASDANDGSAVDQNVVATMVDVDVNAADPAPIEMAVPVLGLATVNKEGGSEAIQELSVPGAVPADGERRMTVSLGQRPGRNGGKGKYISLSNGADAPVVDGAAAAATEAGETAAAAAITTITPESTPEDVIAWMISLPADLNRYADAIREGSIDGAAFLGTEFDDLTAAIGLVSLGHKRILKQALEAFTTGKMEGPMSPTTAQEFEVTREGATSNDDACLDDSGDEAGSDYNDN